MSDELNVWCGANKIPTVERRGCGKVELSYFGGFTSWASVFDERTGVLIGRTDGDDVPFGVCYQFRYEFGEPFDCADVTECTHCADKNVSNAPPACAL